MELLQAQRVTHLVGGSELLADVSLRLAQGDRVGLVGPNGSGKSTLLRLLAGQEPAYAGRLIRAPGVRVGYLPQSGESRGADESVWQYASRSLALVRELEGRMRDAEARLAGGAGSAHEYDRLLVEFEQAGGFGAEAALRKELAAVGFVRSDDDRAVTSLSAGERRRLELAGTLAELPDLLLLDEPTNHLDLAARVRLARRLAGWHGALVVVSHDRALLDDVTNRTAFLQPQGANGGRPSRLVLETGHYAVALQRRDGAARAGHRRERERAKEAARLESMAAELATFGHKAAARKRAAERTLSRLRAGVGRSRTLPRTPRLADTGKSAASRGSRLLIEASALASPPQLTGAHVTVRAGDRVAVLGPNGSGKSTLLALLSGERPSTDPASELRFASGLRLRSVGQEDRGLLDGVSLWEQVEGRAGAVAGGRLLAGAGVPPAVWSSAPDALSGGERARAGLALALVEEADVWLLDEPTNDLDLAAVEALELQLHEKLEASGAALLLATHDRRLAQRLTRDVWAIEDGAVVRYKGVEEYLAGQRSDEPADPQYGQSDHEAVKQNGHFSHVAVDEPVPGTGTASKAGPLEPTSARGLRLDDLETRRSELLRLRDEEPHLSERERQRLLSSLALLEEELMAAYGARLPAPAPRYRLVEHGVTLFADSLPAPETDPGSAAAAPRLVLVAPQPFPTGVADERQAEVVAARALEWIRLSGAELTDPDRVLADCAAAWLEARLEGEVGHLRFVERTQACATPHALAALADAGARLAFTRLGAKAVQLHHAGALQGTVLRPAGNGWWSLGLGQFLKAEGWST